MKRILLTLFAIIVSFAAVAQNQNFLTDAELLSQNGNVVVISSSGLGKNKKEAIESAIQSAFYTYMTIGIEGLNNGRPLISKEQQEDFAVKNYINSIIETRYNNFIRDYQVTNTDKTLDRRHKAQVILNMYSDAFIKDIVAQGYAKKKDSDISLEETSENMIIPTVMVVPRTTEGKTIKEVMDSDAEYRSIVSKLAQAFLKEGVETKSFDEMYDALGRMDALTPNMSNDDMILSMSTKGVDVVVYADLKTLKSATGTSVELSLNAVDAATRSILAAVSETSKPFKNASVSSLSGMLAEAIAPSFMEQVSTSFARNVSRGQGISIRFTLDQNSTADFSTEVTSDGFTIGDLARLWIRKNAKDGKYRVATQSPTLIIYDQIFIPTQTEGGMFNDVNDFELELRQYLRGEGVLISKRLLNGNEIIYTLTF